MGIVTDIFEFFRIGKHGIPIATSKPIFPRKRAETEEEPLIGVPAVPKVVVHLNVRLVIGADARLVHRGMHPVRHRGVFRKFLLPAAEDEDIRKCGIRAGCAEYGRRQAETA